jgi:hypothetical protein
MPSDLLSTKIKNADFEWMLCLANIRYWLQAVPSPRNPNADSRPSGMCSCGATSTNPRMLGNHPLNLRDVNNRVKNV